MHLLGWAKLEFWVWHIMHSLGFGTGVWGYNCVYSFIHIEYKLDEIWAAIKHDMIRHEEEKAHGTSLGEKEGMFATQHLELNVVTACQGT